MYHLRGRALRVSVPIELLGDVSLDGNIPVFDCGGSTNGALELLAGGFIIANITFRNCGGAAPILIDLRASTTGIVGEIVDCRFENNAGSLAGGVAIFRESTNVVDLNIRGCTFLGNEGVQGTIEEVLSDYEYSDRMMQAMSASALALGRGSYTISRCNFTSNVPSTKLYLLKLVRASTPVDLNCWQGPAEYRIEDSVFRSNSGRLSGGVHLHDNPLYGIPAAAGCNLALRRVDMDDVWGHHAGALLVSCSMTGSSCTVTIEESQVTHSVTAVAGVITARETVDGSGITVTATHLTLAHNVGAYSAKWAVTTFKRCRVVNNTAQRAAVMQITGGSFQAFDTEFAFNKPYLAYRKTAAVVALGKFSFGNIVQNCTFIGNNLHALGVFSGATLELSNSRFLQNVAYFSQYAANPYGSALVLLGSGNTTVHNTTFYDNVAVAGGAVALVGCQSVTFSSCVFRGNRAISGGALEVDDPGSSIVIKDTTFVNNSALDLSDWLYDLGAWADTYSGVNPVGLFTIKDDYTMSSSDTRALEFMTPVEGCGNGGGGALCVRGASGVTVTLENVTLQGNRALMGGGLYVATGSACTPHAGCYRMELRPDVTFKDNWAELAGGAVYWLHERVVRTHCSAVDYSLAVPAWPGLLTELQSHSYTAISLTAGATTAVLPAAVWPPPSPSPQNSDTSWGVTSTPQRQQRYLQRAAPCASWSGNTVGDSGYGPHIASSAFYHQPVLDSPEGSAIVTSNAATASLAPLALAAAPPLVAASPAARVRLRRMYALERQQQQQQQQQQRALQQEQGSGPSKDPSTASRPLSPPPPPPPEQQFASGDNVPVAVHILDFYGQKVKSSLIDSSSAILVTCTSSHALGQKTEEAVDGVANFTQLLVRDKVGETYSLTFTARTAIRAMGPVSIDITVRSCRINEELASSGDSCVPCIEGFYSIVTSGNSSNSGALLLDASLQQAGDAAVGTTRVTGSACIACPEGAVCSSEDLSNVISPQDGFWHSGPWSDNILKCPYKGACKYGKRTELVAIFQAKLSNAHDRVTHGSAMDASAAYREVQCAPGYKGNLCASCEEGYGRISQKQCSRCRGPLVRLGYGLLVLGITFASITATIRAALTPQLSRVDAVGDLELTASSELPGSAVSRTTPIEGKGREGGGFRFCGAAVVDAVCDGGMEADPDGFPVGATKHAYGAAALRGDALAPLRGPASKAVGMVAVLLARGDQRDGGGGGCFSAMDNRQQRQGPVTTAAPGGGGQGTHEQNPEGRRRHSPPQPPKLRQQQGPPHLGRPLKKKQPQPDDISRYKNLKLWSDLESGAGVSGDVLVGSSTTEVGTAAYIELQAAAPRPAGEPDKVSLALLVNADEVSGSSHQRPRNPAGCGHGDPDGPTAAHTVWPQPPIEGSWPLTETSESLRACGAVAHQPRNAGVRPSSGSQLGGIHRTTRSGRGHSCTHGKTRGGSEDTTATTTMTYGDKGGMLQKDASDKSSGAALVGAPVSSDAPMEVVLDTPILEAEEGPWLGDNGGDMGASCPGETGPAGRAAKEWRRSKRTGYFAGRSWRQRIDIVSEHATVIKILVSYLQVLVLVNNTPVPWPRALVYYFDVLAQISSAAMSLFSLECSMRTDHLSKSVQTLVIAVLAPAYWSAALCLLWVLRAAWLCCHGRLSGPGSILLYLRTRCIVTVNCIIFIQYPSVVSQLFSLFSCMQIDTGPQQLVCVDPWDPATCAVDKLSVGQYWTRDLEQHCYEGIHLRLCLIIGVPGVILFAAGIPLLNAWWLYRNRQRLRDDDFIGLYGTLYQEYEDNYYCWESIVMLRKLAITAVIVFAGTYHWQITLLLALGIIALALMAQVAYRPYESDAMDELERLGLATTLMTFYLATYFLSDSVGGSVQAGLSFAILVLNSVTIFVMIVATARELHRAAIYKLLRMSSARGDLPLSFVLRIGCLYLGWQLRVALTRLRIWLHGMAPACCPLGFPPGADESEDAAATARTAARRAAWERHHREAWTWQVMRLAEQALPGAGAAPDEPRAASAAAAGADKLSSWKGFPNRLVQGAKRAAMRIDVYQERLTTCISVGGSSGRHMQQASLAATRHAGAGRGADPEAAAAVIDFIDGEDLQLGRAAAGFEPGPRVVTCCPPAVAAAGALAAAQAAPKVAVVMDARSSLPPANTHIARAPALSPSVASANPSSGSLLMSPPASPSTHFSAASGGASSGDGGRRQMRGSAAGAARA